MSAAFRAFFALLPFLLAGTAGQAATTGPSGPVSAPKAAWLTTDPLDLASGRREGRTATDTTPGDFDFDAPFHDSDGNRVGRRGFWSEGFDIRDLGDLPGGPAEAVAHGSNRKGQIVGESLVESGGHAFLWENGRGMTDLGDLPGGEASSVARAINEAGQVVGRARSEDGDRAFLWDADSGMVDLNDLVAPPEGVVLRDATGIDEAGRIIGQATAGPEGAAQSVPFVWDPATSRLDILGGPDLARTPARAGALPAVVAGEDRAQPAPLRLVSALGLVTNGPVVGRAVDGTGRSRPVLWLPEAGLLDLGALSGDLAGSEGTAHAVNSAGQVVGQSTGPDGRPHAFLWEAERGMVDLDTLLRDAEGVTLVAAVDIIDDGRILAWGIEDDVVHFYRLTLTGPARGLPAADEEVTAGPDAARIVPVALEDGTGGDTEGQAGYTLTDLGQLVLGADPAPILSMDESGRVVGGCDLLALDCPYLWNNLEQVTNFVPETTPGGVLPGSVLGGPFGGGFIDGRVSTAGPGVFGRTFGAPGPIDVPGRARGGATLPTNLFSGLLSGSSTGGTTGTGPTGAGSLPSTPPGGAAVVPLPPAGAALGLGLLCLFGLRRGRRATA